MSGRFTPLAGRVALLWAVPAVSSIAGMEADSVAVVLSLLASLAELALFGFAPKGRKGKKSIRPARLFPLQLGLLYCMQLWLLMFHHVGAAPPRHRSPAPPTALAAREAPAARETPTAREAPAPPHRLRQEAASKPGEPKLAPSGHAGMPVGFELDAPPESLRWSPKTISVVLPCAEEREYAVKTVESFFKMTPEDVLHEIVVVDDGSQPPLSQKYLTPELQKKYKIKICRHEETVGLIGAKKTGGDAASGDIVAFFDCHVAPQKDWYKDFLRLIGENYRRMVIPQITNLDVETWTQMGEGGGMSKCYVTWDGDFKWGGPDDQYMGMLSGGLLGMSKRWWDESGGYDDKMLGWGGENIDQGVRMWVCGGEIVAAPNSQVAHMWRTGSAKTNARYKHVGDTMKNRARAINAWFGEFAEKLDDFPEFVARKTSGGQQWYGDMSNFDKVKQRLQGCRPFAWYLRRFKSVYEDGGLIPPDVFMIKDMKSGQCLHYMGRAGTSGAGREGVDLKECDASNHRFFWHLGNVDRRTGLCCSGLRAWNTDQCFQGAEGGGRPATGICEVSGRNPSQHWALRDGQLRRHDRCIGPGERAGSLKEAPCVSFRSQGGARFEKEGVRKPIERVLYDRALNEHPETYRLLNKQLAEAATVNTFGPAACREHPGSCVALALIDPSVDEPPFRCLDEQGALSGTPEDCVPLLVVGTHVKRAESGDCLDNWSDQDPETWGFYGCHDGDNQKFRKEGPGRVCSTANDEACFASHPWPVSGR